MVMWNGLKIAMSNPLLDSVEIQPPVGTRESGLSSSVNQKAVFKFVLFWDIINGRSHDGYFYMVGYDYYYISFNSRNSTIPHTNWYDNIVDFNHIDCIWIYKIKRREIVY
jgi:hypothetical protein